jgi:hypothetical protein
MVTGAQACAPAPGSAVSAPGSAAGVEPRVAPIPERDSDEGMWTVDNFPTARVQAKHGFGPTQAWLDHVRLASVRLANGCSGSFVSPRGLVMTNHHCAHRCIQQLSTAKRDYVKSGFQAAKVSDELVCPALEVDQLVEIRDVTFRVMGAAGKLAEAQANEARKGEMSKIEKECATDDNTRCDVVTLYRGGRYHRYKYRRFQDVRLAFAPELAIAFFGGDPDNFNFPRYGLDLTFLRVYENGQPAKTEHYFRWSGGGVKAGDLAFVAGHPGSTSRQLTVAQLEYTRDYALPARLLRMAERRGMLSLFQTRGAEQARIARATLFGVENALKALRGRHDTLLDPRVFEAKRAKEQALRAKVADDPALRKAVGGAWDAIAAAQRKKKQQRIAHSMLERGDGFWSTYFEHARALVRAAEELPKPNEKRLREFADSKLPAVRQQLLSAAPIYDELEIAKLTQSLMQLREALGPDHPVVRLVLSAKSPQQVAQQVVQGTGLDDVRERERLLAGGIAAIGASKDPAIQLAKLVDPAARQTRQLFEDQVEAVEQRAAEQIAQARFELFGRSEYPDATTTLRISYGRVKGWEENGTQIEPVTTFGGAFERHTGVDPFALPQSWLGAKPKLDLSTPFNFCSTNDIIGGNSGSPVIDKDALVVGLIFDGNIHSLGGDYWFDDAVNRAVAVHSEGILVALEKIYGETRVRNELLEARAK